MLHWLSNATPLPKYLAPTNVTRLPLQLVYILLLGLFASSVIAQDSNT